MGDILNRLCNFLPCDIAHLFAKDQDARVEQAVTTNIWTQKSPNKSFRKFKEVTEDINFLPGEGMIGKALQKETALQFNIEDYKKDYLRYKEAQSAGLESCLMIPVATINNELFWYLQAAKTVFLLNLTALVLILILYQADVNIAPEKPEADVVQNGDLVRVAGQLAGDSGLIFSGRIVFAATAQNDSQITSNLFTFTSSGIEAPLVK